MNDLMNIDRSLPSLSQDKLISVLLYGSDAFDNKKNRKILICTVQFIKNSHRFDDSLFLILSTLLEFANSNILTSFSEGLSFKYGTYCLGA